MPQLLTDHIAVFDSPRTSRWEKLAPVVSAIIALLVYAVTLGGTYIYDDAVDIRDDPRISLPRLWLTYLYTSYNGGVDNLFRPLVSLSFAIQTWPGGNHIAMWMHLGNWLLHAAVSAAVTTLAIRLYRDALVGIVAGCLFAVLPIHVEAVAGIVGRAELMCSLGLVGALISILKKPMTLPRACAACACLVLALGSKEQGLLLPLLAIVMALCLGIRRPANEQERVATLVMVAVGCLLTAGYIDYRESILKFGWDRTLLDWTEQPMIRSRGADVVLLPIALLGRYAALIVVPWRLTIDYGGRLIGWSTTTRDPYVWIGLGTLISWMGLVVIAFKRRWRATLFCLLAAAIVYAMVGNIIVLIGTNFGERLMYLPSVFLCIVAAAAIGRLPRQAAIVVAVLLVTAGGVRTFAYARQWNDRWQFYRTQSAAHPGSVRLHMLVADEAIARGDLASAAEADRLAQAVEPDYVEAWIQSANVAMQQGRLTEAHEFIGRGMEIAPSRAQAWSYKVNAMIAATRAAATRPAATKSAATIPISTTR